MLVLSGVARLQSEVGTKDFFLSDEISHEQFRRQNRSLSLYISLSLYLSPFFITFVSFSLSLSFCLSLSPYSLSISLFILSSLSLCLSESPPSLFPCMHLACMLALPAARGLLPLRCGTPGSFLGTTKETKNPFWHLLNPRFEANPRWLKVA